MAIGDELDKLLSDDRLLKEDWEGFEKILGLALPTESHLRRTLASKEIRHNYGHTVSNLLREWYEPDYSEIVCATAKKLYIENPIFQSVTETEDQILSRVIVLAKENIIKEHGQIAWDEVEKKVKQDVDEIISKAYSQQGFLLPEDIEHLEKVRSAGVMAMLLNGKLAGTALYTILNQTFFSMSRILFPLIAIPAIAPMVGIGALGILTPVLWPWLFVSDMGNTNWKKTIPSVVIVASYRRKLGLV